jgi:Holliday junction resolvasome RuvABC endonuclease subunit
MNTLALDFGTASGYAIEKDGKIISGVKKLRHNRHASGVRALDFYSWLTQMIREHGITHVYFERVYAHSGVEAAHLYGYFMHTLAAVCEEYGIECVGFSVGTIKKFMTGKGNATKDEMIAAAKSRGFNPQTDDEADALAMLFLALKTNSLPGDGSSLLPGPERERAAAPRGFASVRNFCKVDSERLKYEER